MGEANSPSQGGTLTFRVHIHEGTNLGPDLQACVCHVSLGDSVRQTPFTIQRDRHVWDTVLQYSISSKEQWRRLCSSSTCKVVVYRKAKDSTGASTAPSTSPNSTADLHKLGWVVLDLRQAKLNRQYNKDQGEWYTFVGTKSGTGLSPRLRISYHLEEDLVRDTDATSKLESDIEHQVARALGSTEAAPLGLPAVSQAAVAGAQPQAAARPSLSSQPSYSSDFSNHSGGSAKADHQTQQGANATIPTQQHRVQAGHEAELEREPSLSAGEDGQRNDQGMPGSTSGPAQAPAKQSTAASVHAYAPTPAPGPTVKLDEGPLKSFTLSIDVRSFQASRHMPFNVCSTYVQAMLPSEIKEVVSMHGGRVPSRMSPLVSRPAVDVARGMEQPIPNGSGSVEFVCGVLHLARVLAREPRISCEVWHKERLRADTLVGLASVPLSPLLHDCWVDGLAPVYALLASAPTGSASPIEEKVQVGTLRVVLSLQDGPAPAPASASTSQSGQPTAATLAPQPAASSHGAAAPLQPTTQKHSTGSASGAQAQMPYTDTSSSLPQDLAQAGRCMQQQQQQHGQQRHAAPTTLHASPGPGPAQQQYLQQLPPPPHSPAQPAQQQSRAAGSMTPNPGPTSVTGLTPAMIQQLPEYEVAYQLEVWKKAEEAKWRAELKSREAARMSVLESEWRQKDALREAEINTMRQEYVALDARARQVLAAVEERERKLVSAEEAAALRRRDMEREHTARMAEAEAAVRRLQVECEHQLEIERDRNTELARLRLAAEERLAAAETRAAALEQAFAAYREQMRNTSEAALAREVMTLQDQLQRAQDKAAKLHKAKDAYKAQVVQLAEQVAALQRRLDAMTAAGGPDAGRKQWLHDSSVYALQQAADQQARYANAQQSELAAIRMQLQVLKQSALSSPGPVAQAGRHATPVLTPLLPGSAVQHRVQLAPQAAVVNEPDIRRSLDQITRQAPQPQPAVQPQAVSAVMELQAHPISPPQQQQHTQLGHPSTSQQPQHMQSASHQPQPAAHTQQAASQQPRAVQPPQPTGQASQQVWPSHSTAAAQQAAAAAVEPHPLRLASSTAVDVASQTGFGAAGHGETPTRSHPSAHGITPSHLDGQSARSQYHDGDDADLQGSYYGITISGAGIGVHAAPRQGIVADAGGEHLAAPLPVDSSPPHVARGLLATTTTTASPRQATVQASQPNLGEIQRLLRRKSELLATGAYPADDPLIRRIEERVAELAGLPHS